jgi:hypothetical protein
MLERRFSDSFFVLVSFLFPEASPKFLLEILQLML